MVVVSLYHDYSGGTIALVLACRQKGIPVFELPHGTVGKHLFTLTDWSCIPDEGYDFVPDGVLCWEMGLKHILESSVNSSVNLIPVEIPLNLRFPKSLKIKNNQSYNNLKLLVSTSDLVVMFAGQPGVGLTPSIFKSILLSAPKSWFWLIRLHTYDHQMVSTWIDIFNLLGINNYDIDIINNISIMEAIDISDHVITSFSSVVYDALAMGTPSTIISKLGLDCYEDEIKSNLFHYHQSVEKILENIQLSSSLEHSKVNLDSNFCSNLDNFFKVFNTGAE